MTERSDGSMPIWSLTSFPGFSARPYKKVLPDTQQLDCPWERGCVELGEVWGDLPFLWRFGKCQDPDLNWGHGDFQSPALPTELSRLAAFATTQS